jgi:hypothetical protein
MMMSWGIMPMLHSLSSDDESLKAIRDSIGQKIRRICLVKDGHSDGELSLYFQNGTMLSVFDDGRSCCEERYLHTDDDLNAFIGAELLDLGLLDGPTVQDEDEYDEPHEMQFLIVSTSLGIFTVETHNIHNGYYGGFIIRARLEASPNSVPKGAHETPPPSHGESLT